MQRLRRTVPPFAVVLAAVLVVAAWQQGRPDLDADDARAFTRRALEHVALADIVVDTDVRAATYHPRTGGESVPVWETRATVTGGTVTLFVQRDAGLAVFVEDRTTDGGRQLLTDDQFAALADYEHDPPLDRRLRRNLAATLAGLAIVGVSVAEWWQLAPLPDEEST